MAFPTFSPGDVLNASDMNAVGMWLIKSQTIGTTVSSIAVTSVFSADYENYRIVVSGGVASGSAGLFVQLGSTTTGYYSAGVETGASYAASSSAVSRIDQPSQPAGLASTASLAGVLDVLNPFATKRTSFLLSPVGQSVTTGYAKYDAGFLDDATSYTDFTLIVGSAQTLTGGTIFVYGYRG
jgi:hypothetical protein